MAPKAHIRIQKSRKRDGAKGAHKNSVVRIQSAVKDKKSKVKSQKSKVKSQKSKVKSQKSKVKSEKSKVKSEKSKVKIQIQKSRKRDGAKGAQKKEIRKKEKWNFF